MTLSEDGRRFSVWRMLPPTRVRYFFTVAGQRVAASSVHGDHGREPRTSIDAPQVPTIVNFIDLSPAAGGKGAAQEAPPLHGAGHTEAHALPRVMVPPPVASSSSEKRTRPFSKALSMFAKYKVRNVARGKART